MADIDTFVHGWNHRPDDPRDLTIGEVLEAAGPIGIAWALYLKNPTAKNLKAWGTLVTAAIDPNTPPPPPPPPSPPGRVIWANQTILDQGQTGHCVGFTGADFEQDDPVEDPNVTNQTGHDIYYACKIVDGEPRAENGSNMRSLAVVLKQLGRIQAYAFATSMADVKTWILTKGPVMVGTDWYNAMFTPDAHGFVVPGGGVAGGHAWSLIGYDPTTDVFDCQNHWGTGWALGGLFKITGTNLATLLSGNGEAVVAVELPV